eukprot:1055272-Amorphochlora_amoeboformis.AAC.1
MRLNSLTWPLNITSDAARDMEWRAMMAWMTPIHSLCLRTTSKRKNWMPEQKNKVMDTEAPAVYDHFSTADGA